MFLTSLIGNNILSFVHKQTPWVYHFEPILKRKHPRKNKQRNARFVDKRIRNKITKRNIAEKQINQTTEAVNDFINIFTSLNKN